MSSGIPVPTFWVRPWSGITEDIFAMVLLWMKASTMICSWKKGRFIKLPFVAFCKLIVRIRIRYFV